MIQDHIDKAFEHNIVVYDGSAEPGQFTKRLISLMKTVMWRNHNIFGPNVFLDSLYVSDLAFQLIVDYFKQPIIVDKSIDPTSFEHIMFGVKIKSSKALGLDSVLNQYYLHDLKGNFPEGRQELVVGVSSDGNQAILGCF